MPNVTVTDSKVTIKTDSKTSTKVIKVSSQGPRGNSNVFIGNAQPAVTTPYLWIQTGLGDGDDFTLWINTEGGA